MRNSLPCLKYVPLLVVSFCLILAGAAHARQDGIYKNSTGLQNAYIQTYDEDGSMVAILTSDLFNYKVFVLGSWPSSASVTDALNSKRTATFSRTSDKNITLQLRLNGSTEFSGNISKAFGAPDEVVGVPTKDGIWGPVSGGSFPKMYYQTYQSTHSALHLVQDTPGIFAFIDDNYENGTENLEELGGRQKKAYIYSFETYLQTKAASERNYTGYLDIRYPDGTRKQVNMELKIPAIPIDECAGNRNPTVDYFYVDNLSGYAEDGLKKLSKDTLY